MLLNIYRECCFNRYFEYKVAEYLDKKIVKPPVYLSVGTEYIPILLKYALKELNITKYNIFAQHRCHSYHNTFIQEPLKLALELCGSKDGCNAGYGGSASISGENNSVKMWGHDGLLGTNAPIAVGYAKTSKELTICILGDAAVEEDYVLSTLGYTATHNCPVLFIVEDNNLSILTEKKIRRIWDITRIAQSFGVLIRQEFSTGMLDLSCYSLKQDLEFVRSGCPKLINFFVERHFWHAGSGTDSAPKYDYFNNFEKELLKNYSSSDLTKIAMEEDKRICDIWDKQLLKQLKK